MEQEPTAYLREWAAKLSHATPAPEPDWPPPE